MQLYNLYYTKTVKTISGYKGYSVLYWRNSNFVIIKLISHWNWHKNLLIIVIIIIIIIIIIITIIIIIIIIVCYLTYLNDNLFQWILLNSCLD